MTKTALGLLAWMAITATAYTQDFYIHQRLGNIDFWSGPNGKTITGNRIGNFEFYNDNRGRSWTVYDFDSEDDED